MESINKFKYFEKKEELEKKLETAKSEYDKYTSFVADTLEVYTHGKFYKCDVDKSYIENKLEELYNSSIITKSDMLKEGGNAGSVIEAGYSYSGCDTNITEVTGFSYNSPDSVVVTNNKISSFPTNVHVMAGIFDIGEFDYYIYCFSYVGRTIFVNVAGYYNTSA